MIEDATTDPGETTVIPGLMLLRGAMKNGTIGDDRDLRRNLVDDKEGAISMIR